MTAVAFVALLGDSSFDVCRCGASRWLHVDGTGPCRLCQARETEPACQGFDLAATFDQVPGSKLRGEIVLLMGRRWVEEIVADMVAVIEDAESERTT